MGGELLGRRGTVIPHADRRPKPSSAIRLRTASLVDSEQVGTSGTTSRGARVSSRLARIPGDAWPSATARRITAHATACEHVPNARELGVDRPLIQVRRAHHLRQDPGGIEEHGVGDASDTSRPQTQSDAGKDERVVPLADAVRPTAMDDRVGRAAGCNDRATIGPPNRLLGRALALARRVRQGKHDRPVVQGGHGADDGFREQARRARRADEDRGLEIADGFLERNVSGIAALVRRHLLDRPGVGRP